MPAVADAGEPCAGSIVSQGEAEAAAEAQGRIASAQLRIRGFRNVEAGPASLGWLPRQERQS